MDILGFLGDWWTAFLAVWPILVGGAAVVMLLGWVFDR